MEENLNSTPIPSESEEIPSESSQSTSTETKVVQDNPNNEEQRNMPEKKVVANEPDPNNVVQENLVKENTPIEDVPQPEHPETELNEPEKETEDKVTVENISNEKTVNDELTERTIDTEPEEVKSPASFKNQNENCKGVKQVDTDSKTDSLDNIVENNSEIPNKEQKDTEYDEEVVSLNDAIENGSSDELGATDDEPKSEELDKDTEDSSQILEPSEENSKGPSENVESPEKQSNSVEENSEETPTDIREKEVTSSEDNSKSPIENVEPSEKQSTITITEDISEETPTDIREKEVESSEDSSKSPIENVEPSEKQSTSVEENSEETPTDIREKEVKSSEENSKTQIENVQSSEKESTSVEENSEETPSDIREKEVKSSEENSKSPIENVQSSEKESTSVEEDSEETPTEIREKEVKVEKINEVDDTNDTAKRKENEESDTETRTNNLGLKILDVRTVNEEIESESINETEVIPKENEDKAAKTLLLGPKSVQEKADTDRVEGKPAIESKLKLKKFEDIRTVDRETILKAGTTIKKEVNTAEKTKLLGQLSLMVNRRKEAPDCDKSNLDDLIDVIDNNERLVDTDREELRQEIIKRVQKTKLVVKKKSQDEEDEDDDICILEDEEEEKKPVKISIKPVETLKETKRPGPKSATSGKAVPGKKKPGPATATGKAPVKQSPSVAKSPAAAKQTAASKSAATAQVASGQNQTCAQCMKRQYCKFKLVDTSNRTKSSMAFLHFCSENCVFQYQGAVKEKSKAPHRIVPIASGEIPLCISAAMVQGSLTALNRICTWCSTPLNMHNVEVLAWETFEFCKVSCLQLFQKKIGAKCSHCSEPVCLESLGKYCVRFGCHVNQFCKKLCLDAFKARHRPCFFCQYNMSDQKTVFRVEKKSLSGGLLSKVVSQSVLMSSIERNDNYMDFCKSVCFNLYWDKFKVKHKVVGKCGVCRAARPIMFQVEVGNQFAVSGAQPTSLTKPLCSDRCLKAYTFVQKINPVCCESCLTYFDDTPRSNGEKPFYKIFYQGQFKIFCHKLCHNYFIQSQRSIVECAWCKVKKYNFDMIIKNVNRTTDQTYLCSMNCLTYFSMSTNVTVSKKSKTGATLPAQQPQQATLSTTPKNAFCDNCSSFKPARFHLSSGTADSSGGIQLHNFCSYECTLRFQSNLNKLFGTKDAPNKIIPATQMKKVAADSGKGGSNDMGQLIISDVRSLASSKSDDVTTASPILAKKLTQLKIPSKTTVQFTAYKKGPPQPDADLTLALKLAKPPTMCNKVTQVRPLTITKGVYCKPVSSGKSIQTGDDIGRPTLIPVPIPIYIPAPCAMYSTPFPVLVPIPVPIPIPIFIPTTRNSIKGIMREIQNIHEKIPSDPFEAEMLLMAQMAEETAPCSKPVVTSDSEQEDDGAKENTVPAHDLNTNTYPPTSSSEAITNYSLSHFLPPKSPALDPLAHSELEVASSVDLIDAESTLSLSKIVKTPGLQGTEESLLQTATSYGVRAKISEVASGRTRSSRGGRSPRTRGGRGRGRGARGRGRGRGGKRGNYYEEEEESTEEEDEREEENIEVSSDEYEPPVGADFSTQEVVGTEGLATEEIAADLSVGAREEIIPQRTISTRRSQAATSSATNNTSAASGSYIENAQDLTPQDFIPSEYLGHMIDDEGNLVYDAESNLKSPPGMYQSDEDFSPDFEDDVDDPDFDDEDFEPRRKKRSAPAKRRSVRSRQSTGYSQLAAAVASITPQDTPSPSTRAQGTRSGGRAGNKRKLDASLTPKANQVTTIAPPVQTKSPDEVSLKFMLGVDAINKFIAQKNLEMQKSIEEEERRWGLGRSRVKPFKTELLSMTPDELNRILCYFIKEVRRPNGSQYAPDTMYYLCLCIQYYLIKHDRIDNIFSDPFYMSFILTLDGIAQTFIQTYNDTDVIVTRVEEEYLWESKQLGAYSPHTLINTLMYFNTKFFLRFSLSEHDKLSFQRLTINWKFGLKKGPKILRMLIMDDSLKLTKVEIEEDQDQPLRCPVKLYEFYLSKCPDTVKNSYDLLYLAPEHSCVPESPIWFSNTKLDKDTVGRTLNRIKMVKEIVSIM